MGIYSSGNKIIELNFAGYTWEEYFHVIANKSGILITYRGNLDDEGKIRLKEIIFVDEADDFFKIYESESFKNVVSGVNKKDRLFFSYAEMDDVRRREVMEVLKIMLMPEKNNVELEDKVSVICKGACALFPNQLLAE